MGLSAGGSAWSRLLLYVPKKLEFGGFFTCLGTLLRTLLLRPGSGPGASVMLGVVLRDLVFTPEGEISFA